MVAEEQQQHVIVQTAHLHAHPRVDPGMFPQEVHLGGGAGLTPPVQFHLGAVGVVVFVVIVGAAQAGFLAGRGRVSCHEGWASVT